MWTPTSGRIWTTRRWSVTNRLTLRDVERVAAVRSSGGMFGLGASDPYDCMRDELRVALGVLREAAGVQNVDSDSR